MHYLRRTGGQVEPRKVKEDSETHMVGTNGAISQASSKRIIPVYPRLLSAYSVSVFGDTIYKVALMWWVLSETGSTVFMASIGVASAITSVVLGTVAGAISDLIDKRKFMIVGDTIRGIGMCQDE